LNDVVETFRLLAMPTVRTEDLIDAHGVAEILSLSHSNSVSTYQRRYEDMPRPVVDLGAGRPRLWLRSEIEQWAALRSGSSDQS
jgi:glutathione-regulated potassium-efflux system ancillary protein KefG